jgi:hypothetical protein
LWASFEPVDSYCEDRRKRAFCEEAVVFLEL